MMAYCPPSVNAADVIWVKSGINLDCVGSLSVSRVRLLILLSMRMWRHLILQLTRLVLSMKRLNPSVMVLAGILLM